MSSCGGNCGSGSGCKCRTFQTHLYKGNSGYLPSPPNNRMKRRVSSLKEEYLRDDSPALRSFNRLCDQAKAKAKNEEEAQSLMTHLVCKDLIYSRVKKALKVIHPKRTKRKAVAHKLRQFFRSLDFGSHVTDMPKTKPEEEQEKEEEKRSTKPLLFSWVRKKKRVQRKNPRMIDQKAAGADLSADMPTEFYKKVMELQGLDVKMVIEKVISKTDLDCSCNRLSIPKKKTKVEFLTEEEQANIVQRKNDGLHFQGMKVSLIEPNLKVSEIWLKKWNVGKSMSYMLSSPWISVATKNKLKVDDVIQLWSFRVNGTLWFALTKLNNWDKTKIFYH